jgi:ubiquitin C-terminal hydrolase
MFHRYLFAIFLILTFETFVENVLAGPIGISNMGNTCYASAVLQSLYHADNFRDRLFSEKFTDGSIGAMLRDMFHQIYQLESSDALIDAKNPDMKAIDPSLFIRGCSINPFIQEDAQEFLLKILDEIDSSAISESANHPAKASFAGEIMQYIQCDNIPYRKERKETFYDLSVDLPDSENNDLHDSLTSLFKPDILSGDNKYRAGDNGLQDAKKGISILKLPENLFIHIKRFTFDVEANQLRKVRI